MIAKKFFDIQRFAEQIISGNGLFGTDFDGIHYSISGGQTATILTGDNVPTTLKGSEGSDNITQWLRNPVFVDLASGDDSIQNGRENTTIYASQGNDYVIDSGSNSYIYGGEGDDILRNFTGDNIVIYGEAGNDSITAELGNNISIYGGEGRDSIHISSLSGGIITDAGDGSDYISNYAQKSVLYGGNDNDEIYNIELGENSTIFGGGGNDYIQTQAINVQVNGDEGNDYIINHGSDSTIISGNGDNTIGNYDADNVEILANYSGNNKIVNTRGDGVIIQSGSGNDSIQNNGSNTFINTSAGDDSISVNGSTKNTVLAEDGNDVIDGLNNTLTAFYGGIGNDTISNYFGSHITINGDSGDDVISENGGSYVVINAGEGNDKVNVTVDSNTTNGLNIVNGEAGNDIVDIYRGQVLVNGGDGADTIISNEGYCTIGSASLNGGDGDDVFEFSGNNVGFNQVTIEGGKGNDFINLTDVYRTSVPTTSYLIPSLFIYAEGDGNDTIQGIKAFSSVNITSGTYTTLKNGNDFIIQVGEGSITFANAGDDTVEIYGTFGGSSSTDTPKVEGNSSTETTTGGEINLDGELTVTPSPAIVSAVLYGGGNSTITNYVSEEVINYQTDFTGIGFNNSDFMVNSSSGTLTIQNARDKLMNFAVNDNLVARAFMSSGGGEVNGSGFSELTAFIGGNDASNVLTAGSGGSSLWGGSGGADTLNGGAGQDIFFFGKYDGLDVISNASSSDRVHLYDVNLSDIISANVSGGVISANFNTGGTLQINCTENLSPTFQLADGSQWKFNQSSGQWQND